MKLLFPPTAQKRFHVILALVTALLVVTTMMISGGYALPATPDEVTTNTNTDLGTLLTPGVTIGDPHNTAAFNASSPLFAREAEDAEKYTIAEAVRLINECAALMTSEVPPFVRREEIVRSIVSGEGPGVVFLHAKEAAGSVVDSVLSAKDGATPVLEARKPKWKRILEQIALCCECAACLYQNTQGADCRALCHDCKKPPH